LQKIFNKYYEKAYIKNADVLLVFDTKVQKHTALTEKQDPITDKSCINISYPMALRSGASIDTIYLSDFEKANLDKYKCIVFMNTFALTQTQKEQISKKAHKKGRSVVWFFAPGYTDTKRNDISFCEEVSGFDLDVIAPMPQINVQCEGFSYSVDNSDEESRLNKLFVPKDGEVLGYINNIPALSYKTINGCVVYFSTIPFTTPEAFRYVFERSDVHIYDDCNDAVLEGSGLLLVHAENEGDRTIRFKDTEVTLHFNAGETILFDTETKTVLRRGQ
jgi:ATP-dependent Clp protease adapter protein ClpS